VQVLLILNQALSTGEPLTQLVSFFQVSVPE
jgi:hypothetical protein